MRTRSHFRRLATLPVGDRIADCCRNKSSGHADEPRNFCTATARRLLEIARRNEIRREAKLPLLPIAKELRRIKRQEDLEEFERFAAGRRTAVLEEVLRPCREAGGRPTLAAKLDGRSTLSRRGLQNSLGTILRGTRGQSKFRRSGRPETASRSQSNLMAT